MKRTLLLLLIIGCAPQRPPAPPSTVASGGTRLKAVFAEAEDGASQFVGWRDSKLEVSCAFGALPDGALRCLPTGADVLPINETFYADPGCTRMVADLQPGYSTLPACGAPRFAYASPSGQTCANLAPTYFRVSERVTVGNAFRKSGSGCISSALPTHPWTAGVFQIDPIELDGFVAGEMTPGTAAGGIVPVSVVAEDGARAVRNLRDEKGGFDCAPGPTSEGVRCLPTDRMLVGYRFADSSCKTRAGMAMSCQDSRRASVPYAFESTSFDGKPVNKMFRGGDRLAESFVGNGTTCSKDTGPYGGFAVGEELAPSTFVAASTDSVPMGGGLVALFHHAGGLSLPTELRSTNYGGHPCFLATTTDGVQRCLPFPGIPNSLFSDDGCTRRVGYGDGAVLTELDKTVCPAQVRAFARAGSYEGKIFKLTEGVCEFAFTQGPGPHKITYSSYPDELPPSTFVALPILER